MKYEEYIIAIAPFEDFKSRANNCSDDKFKSKLMEAYDKVGTIVSLYTKSYEHIRYCNYIPMVRVKLDENTGLEYFAVVNNIKKI